MSDYRSYAMREFRAAGWVNEAGEFNDGTQQQICEHIMKLLDVFSDEGHSGSTAPYAVRLFEKLALFKPIVPLTGEDGEWNEVGTGVFQNNRCSRVFKEAGRFGGQAYDIDAVVFYEIHTREDGTSYRTPFTNGQSARPITFPYTPVSTYRQAAASGGER